MLCEHCKQNQATTHVTQIVNGHTQKNSLCSECAAKLGLDAFSGFNISDLLAKSLIGTPAFGQGTVKEFTGNPSPRTGETRCEGCGISFSELAKTGKAGCPQCYTTFYDRLLPSLQRIHGKTNHVGRLPVGASKKAQNTAELVALKEKLSAAVMNQEYEEAAVLRDRIKQLEAENDES